ncbi:MAG: glycosyltransferase family 4 protein [Betaproteobacteria bacterium]|jgi:glycosyltransferase involved in cell wall biosynthesis|nr:glycosyltransferase family 4 protein [Rubrivivax sp.]
MKPRVMIGLNAAWNLANFRGGLIRALLAAGYEVVAVAPTDDHVQRVRELGARFVALPMDSRGRHPGRDLLLLWRLFRIMRAERPSVYLGFTIKPNIYGSLVARLLGVPVINNITGLGEVFSRGGPITALVRGLYRAALKRSLTVFFQNDEDQQLFIDAGLASPSVTLRLPGSGIDIARFALTPLPHNTPVRFLLIARLLWDKGIRQYVEAGRLLRARGVPVQLQLLGFTDDHNPASASSQDVADWQAQGLVQYLGVSHDVRSEIAQADCIVLPSYYREGTPRTLLEAAAMGRPIITTDSIGCRDVVDDGLNGYLCRQRDPQDLADKLERLVALSPKEREAMGRRGREKMEQEFDERIVIQRYLAAIALAVR